MTTTSNDPNHNTSQRQSSSMPILFASILAIGLLLAINFSNRITAGQRIQKVRDSLEMEIATLESEQAVLLLDLDYARSDEYVASWAHSQGKMVREGEVLVVPVPASAPIPAEVEAMPAPPFTAEDEEDELVQPWRLWWALFFDTDPPF